MKARCNLHLAVASTLLLLSVCSAFTTPSTSTSSSTTPATKSPSSSLFPSPRSKNTLSSPSYLAAATLSTTVTDDHDGDGKIGMFSFKTKYGYLNPFAIYYGVTSIILGIPWFVALNICQLIYKVTGDRFDKFRRLPIFFSHVWGVVLLRLTRSYPKIENKEVLDQFFKE
jgi:hypothetical protein